MTFRYNKLQQWSVEYMVNRDNNLIQAEKMRPNYLWKTKPKSSIAMVSKVSFQLYDNIILYLCITVRLINDT